MRAAFVLLLLQGGLAAAIRPAAEVPAARGTSDASARLKEFPRPPHTEYARMCRWLAHAADWGTLATATPGGTPYGGVVSVSDGPAGDPTGRLLFYLTPMDRTTQNLDAGGGASALVLAEASQLPGGCGGTDPESPVCAKATALGRTRPVAEEGVEEAMRLLLARHPEMADWPADHGFAPYELEVEEIHLLDYFAAGGGHLAVLQWLRAQQPPWPWSEWTCSEAAGGGHLAVLQWARAQQPPCPWDKLTCSDAAGGGHLAVLQWARAQQPPCPWDEDTCTTAAHGGHLAVLQWARAQEPPCPWNEWTCSYAASGGHLGVLQWLRAQEPPCPWSEWTCHDAAWNGHLAVLQWARAQEPPCPWDAEECFEEAKKYHRDAVAEWIRVQAALEGAAP
ncbi:hypothetical protein Rsub_05411 [Raphidocelis subcapitata]|uniref:CREG-like beta-barrel domain-containing protein n=1 Tax=Raphidocelis subcapitata TaxID=307507 RepID=A0A2V0P1I8_9CHLO|nr:hypothetical protein Rsub_05411 [Raphidocelis subcapitata]|eukprot:GBF92792.1 hypothetical protein Rsub_05411 [Raphidocelis subcapitata]